MTAELILRYFHFVGIFALFACLVSEHLLLEKKMPRARLRKLASIDAVCGISVIIVLTSGLLLWFAYGKPADFYTKNAVFHTKVLLFVILALISVYPAVFFLKNRKGDDASEISLPKSVIMCIRLELTLLLIIPALAVLIPRGIGSFA